MRKLTAGMLVAVVAIACFMAGGALNERLVEPEIVEAPTAVEVAK